MLRLLALAVLALPLSAAEWLTDYQAALAQAQKEKKGVLLDFTGSDWCGWCIKLKNEVFATKDFEEWAAKNFVLVEVDFPRAKAQDEKVKAQNKQLAATHKIEGYPTIVLLGPDGKKLGELGYVEGGPKTWIAEAEKTVKGGKK